MSNSSFDCLTHLPLTAAIVDLDGTMIDTLSDCVVALNQALNQLALKPVERAFVERALGKGPEDLIRRTLEQAGANAALHEKSLQLYRHFYQSVNGQYAEIYPGVVEGLTALKNQGIKLACVTNKPTVFAQALLKQKRLNDFFNFIFGGDAFKRKKPDPLPLLKTCDALNTVPAQTLMIGDSDNDALAARAAGCPVILVSYGYNHGKPIAAADADQIIDRLDQIDRSWSTVVTSSITSGHTGS